MNVQIECSSKRFAVVVLAFSRYGQGKISHAPDFKSFPAVSCSGGGRANARPPLLLIPPMPLWHPVRLGNFHAKDSCRRRHRTAEAAARPINASTTAPVTRVRLLITLSFLSLDVTRFTKLIIIRLLCPCPPGQEAASSAVPPTARRGMNICTPFCNDPGHGPSARPLFLSFHR